MSEAWLMDSSVRDEDVQWSPMYHGMKGHVHPRGRTSHIWSGNISFTPTSPPRPAAQEPSAPSSMPMPASRPPPARSAPCLTNTPNNCMEVHTITSLGYAKPLHIFRADKSWLYPGLWIQHSLASREGREPSACVCPGHLFPASPVHLSPCVPQYPRIYLPTQQIHLLSHCALLGLRLE